MNAYEICFHRSLFHLFRARIVKQKCCLLPVSRNPVHMPENKIASPMKSIEDDNGVKSIPIPDPKITAANKCTRFILAGTKKYHRFKLNKNVQESGFFSRSVEASFGHRDPQRGVQATPDRTGGWLVNLPRNGAFDLLTYQKVALPESSQGGNRQIEQRRSKTIRRPSDQPGDPNPPTLAQISQHTDPKIISF